MLLRSAGADRTGRRRPKARAPTRGPPFAKDTSAVQFEWNRGYL